LPPTEHPSFLEQVRDVEAKAVNDAGVPVQK